MSNELHDSPRSSPARFKSALTQGCLQATQWRLMVLWLAALTLPVLCATLPLLMALSERLNHSLLASRWADQGEVIHMVEILMTLGQNNFSPAAGGLTGIVLTLLLAPWLHGMVLAASRSAHRLDFGGLLRGGLGEYGRMARMTAWAFLPLGLAGGAAFGLTKWAGEHAASAILESDARLWTYLAWACGALLFFLAHSTVDAARAQLVIEPRRRSVVLAWWKATTTLARRPGRVLLYVVITVVGCTLAALCGWARLQWPASSGAWGVVAGLMLGQLLVLALAWMRSARLFALVAAGRNG